MAQSSLARVFLLSVAAVLLLSSADLAQRRGRAGQPAEPHGKWVELILIPGFGTPAWANEAGQHVNFLGIYEPDVIAPEMQSVLQYGASLFGPKATGSPR